MYDSVLLEQSLIYNRRKDEFSLRDRVALVEEEEERNILPDEGIIKTICSLFFSHPYLPLPPCSL